MSDNHKATGRGTRVGHGCCWKLHKPEMNSRSVKKKFSGHILKKITSVFNPKKTALG